MYTKSRFNVVLLAVSASCAMFAHADDLPDPLAPLPSDAVRPAKANPPATATASPAKSSTTKPVAAQAPAVSEPAPVLVTTAAATPPTPASTSAKVQETSQPSAPVKSVADQAVSERPISAQTTVATFLELDMLRSQNAILAEKVRQKELMDKLANPATNGNGFGTSNGSFQAGTSNSRGVQVFAICGVDNKFSANIVLTNGSTATVHEGSAIAGVGRVKSITIDQVTVVTKSGSIITLEKAPIGAYPGGC